MDIGELKEKVRESEEKTRRELTDKEVEMIMVKYFGLELQKMRKYEHGKISIQCVSCRAE